MSKLLICICCAFTTLLHAQIHKYSPKVSLAIETYAFLKGQSSALQMIAIQFPTLKPNIVAAENNSKVLFKKAKRNIELFLEEELDNSEYNKLKKGLDSLIHEQLKNPIEREKHALDFLKKVSERPHHITDTVLLKGIISFAYHDAPSQEIIDGHINIFNTEGHPKAPKTSLKLTLPKSWLAEEAEMPETIQQFTSYYGRGNEKFLIVVYDFPKEERQFIFDKESITEMLSPETNLIHIDTTTINGRQGIMMEVEEIVNSADNKMKVRMLQFMFIEKRKLYCLQGSIGPVKVIEKLEAEIKNYEPLFRLIVAKAEIDN